MFFFLELTLENTEGAIKNGQSRETGNKTKKKNPKSHNTTQKSLCNSLKPMDHSTGNFAGIFPVLSSEICTCICR